MADKELNEHAHTVSIQKYIRYTNIMNGDAASAEGYLHEHY